MKPIVYLKVGHFRIKPTTRKRMTDFIRKKRSEGFKFKKIIYEDAKAYQSSDPFDPYIFASAHIIPRKKD